MNGAAVRELVLVNGWGMTSVAWQPLVAQLAPRFRCTAIDLPDAAAVPRYAPRELAANVAARAAARCDVIGWSLGAQIALQWAHDCPRQVGRVALMAATPCFVAREDWPRGMPPAVFDAFASELAADRSAALARFALLQARGDANAGAVARILRAAVQAAGEKDDAALHAGLALLRADDLRSLLGKVRQPVCLVHGEGDGLVPQSAAEALRDALPDARLHVVPGAGHAPHVSQPAAIARRLTEFFDER